MRTVILNDLIYKLKDNDYNILKKLCMKECSLEERKKRHTEMCDFIRKHGILQEGVEIILRDD